MHRILAAVGTRPEGIKMAPVIQALQRDDRFAVEVLHSGQHADLLDETLRAFAIDVDHRLDAPRGDGSLAHLTGAVLNAVAGVLAATTPDLVIAQGDTTTVLVTALAAFYAGIPFAHVEAGLRTGDPRLPFPEEMNRRLTADLTALHFAPTAAAVDHLLAEGIARDAITETGNTVIDALLWMVDHAPTPAPPVDAIIADPRPIVLVTAHRRESWGAPMGDIATALIRLVDAHPELRVVFPVHPNPIVREAFGTTLLERDAITLIEPLAYDAFVPLLARASVILTDSGGIQEEAAALGKPVVVMRTVTERGEGVTSGIASLVGTEPGSIVDAVLTGLSNAQPGPATFHPNPYGDGKAAARIAARIASYLS